jgi:hypothetical protein
MSGFSTKSTQKLIQLANDGAGFRLDAAVRPTFDLIQIANAAAVSGARLTFAGITV